MLSIQGLTKRYRTRGQASAAVDDFSLEVEEGELLVLLGPSGCGKTTVLRCLAGLQTPDEGRVVLGKQLVYDATQRLDVPPERRMVGMVFQSYALWPHMTVRQNIAYPLRMRKMKEGLANGWVDDVAALVDCSVLLDRYPPQLSGGQQQRVALARGLVARPTVMLFDEPLSNLDALLRGQVRNELHALHERLRFSGVYVTHDQAEAFALADRVAIMREGRLEQVGPPQEIYERPATEYAANFVGLHNRLTLERQTDGWRIAGTDIVVNEVTLPPEAGERVHLRFRAEDVQLDSPGLDGLRLAGSPVDAVYSGGHEELTMTAGDLRISAWLPTGSFASAGGTIRVVVPWSRSRWFGADGSLLDAVTHKAARAR